VNSAKFAPPEVATSTSALNAAVAVRLRSSPPPPIPLERARMISGSTTMKPSAICGARRAA
jgi:hypothetical protein